MRKSSTEDKILFNEMKLKNDKKAFEKLFSRHYTNLVAYALNFVNQAEAEDVAQDIMAYLWQKRKEINIHTSVSAYLYTSVKHGCLKVISTGNVRPVVLSAVKMALIEANADYDYSDARELAIKLQNALCDLPEEQRRVFEMNRIENKTYLEISEILGVSVKTVEYRMSQVLKKLRIALADYLPLLLMLLHL